MVCLCAGACAGFGFVVVCVVVWCFVVGAVGAFAVFLFVCFCMFFLFVFFGVLECAVCCSVWSVGVCGVFECVFECEKAYRVCWSVGVCGVLWCVEGGGVVGVWVCVSVSGGAGGVTGR